MNLEDIILSEKKVITEGQIGHDFTYMRYLISQTLRTRESNSYCQELREGRNEELLFNGYKVSVQEDEKFWRWMKLTVAQSCECTEDH